MEDKIYKQIVDHDKNPIGVLSSSDLSFIYVNKALRAYLPRKKSNKVKFYFLEICNDSKIILSIKNLKLGESFSFKKNLLIDSKSIFCEINFQLVFCESLNLPVLSFHLNDLSFYVKQEQDLALQNNRIEKIRSRSDIGFWRFIPGIGGFWSKEMFSLFSYKGPSAPVFPGGFLDLIDPFDRSRVSKSFEKIFIDKKVSSVEYFVPQSEKHLRCVATPLLDDGKVVEVNGVTFDLTESKEKEHELQVALSRLEKVQSEAKIGIWEYDLKTGKIYWSKELFELFERKKKSPPTYDEFLWYIDDTHSKKHHNLVEKCLNDHKPYRLEYPLKSGKWILGEGLAEIHSGKVIKLRGTASDISLLKNREMKLEKLNSQLTNLFNLSPFGVAEFNLEDEIIYSNDTLTNLLGFKIMHFNQAAPYIKNIDAIRAKRNDFLSNPKKTMRFDVIYQKEELKYLKVTRYPIFSKSGELVSTMGIFIDVTEKYELNVIKNDLEKFQRLSLVGEASTGIAHELNQPLSVISSSSDLLKRYLIKEFGKIPKSIKDKINLIETSSIQAGNIIHSIKNLYSKKEIDSKLINFDEQMRKVKSLFSSEGGAERFVYKISTELKQEGFYFSPTYLNLILKNLFENSKDAVKNDSTFEVSFDWYIKDDFIVLDYKDNGPGVCESIKDKIFGHFYSNKSTGSGIGLSLIYTIMEFYSGDIKLMESDKGAYFKLRFPYKSTL
ncbi:MAG: hypothetical protein CMP11_09515 [Zetaproteobacteria bacterium]|nr:hypothetical protein [Pseudobdellovibrionaceae bacterium]